MGQAKEIGKPPLLFSKEKKMHIKMHIFFLEYSPLYNNTNLVTCKNELFLDKSPSLVRPKKILCLGSMFQVIRPKWN